MSGRVEQLRQVGLWLRDTGLGTTGYALVTLVAVAGWWASFVGLHAFATAHMSLSDHEGWLVPLTFDGAALGLTVCVARAAMHGRGALFWRLLVVAFTALSSWINWVHIDDPRGRWVAALLPISAVTVFEALMGEARAAYERRSGRVRPRIHPLRWCFDFHGTMAIVRAYVLDVPLPDRYAPGQSASTPVEPTPTGTPVETPVGTVPVDAAAVEPTEEITAEPAARTAPAARSGASQARRHPDRGRPEPGTARKAAPRRTLEQARAEALALVESGSIDPATVTAQDLRRMLRIAPDRCRLIRDELRAGSARSDPQGEPAAATDRTGPGTGGLEEAA